MDPANGREALREIAARPRRGRRHADGQAGARLPRHPGRAPARASTSRSRAYNVSRRVRDGQGRRRSAAGSTSRGRTLEILTSIVRAGADFVLTYRAADAARLAPRGPTERSRRPPDRAQPPTARRIGGRLSARADELIPGGVSSPRPRVRVGRRRAALHRAGARRPRPRRRRPLVHRLRRLLGPVILGHAPPRRRRTPSAPAALADRPSARRPPLEVELAERVTASSLDRDGALRQLRHRGHDERGAPRPRRHGPRRASSSSSGCYHGHGDGFLVGPARASRRSASPDSPGVPEAIAAATDRRPLQRPRRGRARRSTAHPGADRGRHRRAGRGQHGRRPAGAGLPRSGCASSRAGDGALLDLRRGDDRLPRRAAAARRSSTASRPDLTTLGKIIGGGLPVGAYGGAARPHGAHRARRARLPGRHALRAPLAMAAGLAMLAEIEADARLYDRLEALGRALETGLREPSRAPRPPSGPSPASARCGRSSSRRTACARLDRRGDGRHGALRPVLPRDARARHLLAAVAVRGQLPLGGARRRRHRRRSSRRPDAALEVAVCLRPPSPAAGGEPVGRRREPARALLPAGVPARAGRAHARLDSCARPAATCPSTARSARAPRLLECADARARLRDHAAAGAAARRRCGDPLPGHPDAAARHGRGRVVQIAGPQLVARAHPVRARHRRAARPRSAARRCRSSSTRSG